jgi:hypothetical protein
MAEEGVNLPENAVEVTCLKPRAQLNVPLTSNLGSRLELSYGWQYKWH